MKGRRPTPSHLHLVRGNPGHRPLNSKEPKPDRGIPIAPEHMSDKARQIWSIVSPILDRMGVLTEADGLALEVLCEAYADFLLARATLDEFGSRYYTTVSESGSIMHRPHPAISVLQDADRRIRSWLIEFGKTPSSRSRVKSGGEIEEDIASSYFGT